MNEPKDELDNSYNALAHYLWLLHINYLYQIEKCVRIKDIFHDKNSGCKE